MIETIKVAIANNGLPVMESGAKCYTCHLMCFYSQTDPDVWGAGMSGSPIIAFNDTWEHLTIFLVPVREWSDGTADH